MEAGEIMKFGRKTKAFIVGIACWGTLTQQTPSFAGPPVSPAAATTTRVNDAKPAAKKVAQPTAIDVALANGGTVSGHILDDNQQGVANTPVSIRQGKEEVARAMTDNDGRFEIRNLRGGVYLVTSNNGYGLFRFWAPKSAPPAARDQVLLRSQAVVVRAQNYDNGGDVLYDENGQPYARVYAVDNGVVSPGAYPPVGSGGIMGIDCITLTLLGAAIAGAVLGGIALHEASEDEPESPF